MIRKITIAGLILASAMIAQEAPRDETAIGRWEGSSLCTVKPSPCHDENVVYDISGSAEHKGMLVWKADKIVNGVQENMGTLDCRYSKQTLTCELPNKAVWELTVRGDSMTGTLKLADGSLFRKVSVKRVR